jgi:hypothetical protein
LKRYQVWGYRFFPNFGNGKNLSIIPSELTAF